MFGYSIFKFLVEFGFNMTWIPLVLGLLYRPLSEGGTILLRFNRQERHYLWLSFLNAPGLVVPLSKVSILLIVAVILPFCISFVISTLTLRRTNRKMAATLNLQGDEKILLQNCFRGAYLVELCFYLKKNGINILFFDFSAGKVFVADPYDTTLVPLNEEWPIENARREKVDQSLFEISTGDHRSLKFEPNTFDLVLTGMMSFFYEVT
jgi:hypothetical protein